MIKKAIYTGSFDPITNGHMDILIQALSFTEHLVIAVGLHPFKPLFLTFEERSELISQSLTEVAPDYLSRVSVISFDGLAVEKAKEIKAQVIVRGLRDSTDFDYEMHMAAINRCLSPEIQTVFLPSGKSSQHISSTLVRQILTMGGDITKFTPQPVALALACRHKLT